MLADETQDRAKRKQIVIVLHYATQQDKTWVLREDSDAMLDLISEIFEDDETAKDERDDRLVRVYYIVLLFDLIKIPACFFCGFLQ